MLILAKTRDTENADWNGKERVLKEEAQHVWDLQQKEVIRNIWFTDPGNDAVLILECASIEDARKILSDFPLVKDKLIEFEVTRLAPYDGLKRLFPI